MSVINLRRTNVLLLRPCLPEDEGHHHPVCAFDNFDDLSDWMEQHVFIHGFYTSSDFVYAGVGCRGTNRHNIKSLRDLSKE